MQKLEINHLFLALVLVISSISLTVPSFDDDVLGQSDQYDDKYNEPLYSEERFGNARVQSYDDVGIAAEFDLSQVLEHIEKNFYNKELVLKLSDLIIAIQESLNKDTAFGMICQGPCPPTEPSYSEKYPTAPQYQEPVKRSFPLNY